MKPVRGDDKTVTTPSREATYFAYPPLLLVIYHQVFEHFFFSLMTSSKEKISSSPGVPFSLVLTVRAGDGQPVYQPKRIMRNPANVWLRELVKKSERPGERTSIILTMEDWTLWRQYENDPLDVHHICLRSDAGVVSGDNCFFSPEPSLKNSLDRLHNWRRHDLVGGDAYVWVNNPTKKLALDALASPWCRKICMIEVISKCRTWSLPDPIKVQLPADFHCTAKSRTLQLPRQGCHYRRLVWERYLLDRSCWLYALIVLICDGYIRITHPDSEIGRFLGMTARLPLDLQAMLCQRAERRTRDVITGTEVAPYLDTVCRFVGGLYTITVNGSCTVEEVD